jgi:hypothetical protein
MIVTGTANQTLNGFGRLREHDVDPPTTARSGTSASTSRRRTAWSTRIASAVPRGERSSASPTCTARPTGTPLIGTAILVPGDNQTVT